MAKEQTSVRERQRIDLREPRRFKVTIYNDDFTTMEFVVKVLTQVFFKSEAEAETLMLQVHHSEKAVVGIYSYDVATSKVRKATNMAREEGFPLRLTYCRATVTKRSWNAERMLLTGGSCSGKMMTRRPSCSASTVSRKVEMMRVSW